jgi:hypothetical protein
MRKSLSALAVGLLLAGAANAVVVCDSCDYIQGAAATNLGVHNPLTGDNSTFSNATTATSGNNGPFSNWWVFDINPEGNAAINAIFLPLNNISGFDVTLYNVSSATCAPGGGSAGGACSAFTAGSPVASGFEPVAFASALDFVPLDAGRYAFNIVGNISGLAANQVASYTGNLQVMAVPEPDTLALMGVGLLAMGFVGKRRVTS